MKKGLLLLTLVGLLGFTSCGGGTSEPTSEPSVDTTPSTEPGPVGEDVGRPLLQSAVGAIEMNYTISATQVGGSPVVFKVTEDGVYSELGADEDVPGYLIYDETIYGYTISEGEAYIKINNPVAEASVLADLYHFADNYDDADFTYVGLEEGVYSFTVLGAIGEIFADAAGVYDEFINGTVVLEVGVNADHDLTGTFVFGEIALYTLEVTDIGTTVIPEIAVVHEVQTHTLQTAFAELNNKNFTVFIDEWKNTFYNPQGMYVEYHETAIAKGAENYGYVNRTDGIYEYSLDANGDGVLGIKANPGLDFYDLLYTPYDLALFEASPLSLVADATLFDLFFYDADYGVYFLPLEDLVAEGAVSTEEANYIKALFGNLISIQPQYSDTFVEIDIYVDEVTAELYIQCIFPIDGAYYYSDCTIGDIGVTTVPGLSAFIS